MKPTAEEILKMHKALALLSSMVDSGESHSATSKDILKEAFAILNKSSEEEYETNLTAKDFLKTELDKLDRNAFWEIDGTGNVEYVVKAMIAYAAAVKSEPAEGAEEILKKIFGDTTLSGAPIVEIKWLREDMIKAMQEFTALHAQRLADKMVGGMYPKAFVEWIKDICYPFRRINNTWKRFDTGNVEYTLDELFNYWKENVK